MFFYADTANDLVRDRADKLTGRTCFLAKQMKKYKSAVGTVTCNSSAYIQEWCCFQYISGFEKIVICLDDCTDDTYDKITCLPSHVLERVDIAFIDSEPRGHGFQFRGMSQMYRAYRDQVDWFAFFDDDEYLYDHKRRTVNEVIDTLDGENVSQLHLAWLVYGNNRQMLSAPPTETRINWFTRRREFNNVQIVKSISKLDHIDEKRDKKNSWCFVHSNAVTGLSLTLDGTVVSEHQQQAVVSVKTQYFDTCLVHYRHGAMEDYVIRYKIWQGHNRKDSGVPSFEGFIKTTEKNNACEDRRMSIYAAELIDLLAQCRK